MSGTDDTVRWALLIPKIRAKVVDTLGLAKSLSFDTVFTKMKKV